MPLMFRAEACLVALPVTLRTTAWTWARSTCWTQTLLEAELTLCSKDKKKRKPLSSRTLLSRVSSEEEVSVKCSLSRGSDTSKFTPWSLWEKTPFWITIKLSQHSWKKIFFKRLITHSWLVWSMFSKLIWKSFSSWSSSEVVSCSCTWESQDNSLRIELSSTH